MKQRNEGKAKRDHQRFMGRLKRTWHKRVQEKYAKGEGQKSYTLEKYLQRNQGDGDGVLSISEFLDNPKSLVRVQSYDVLKDYMRDHLEIQGTGKEGTEGDQKLPRISLKEEDDTLLKLQELYDEEPKSNREKIQLMGELLEKAEFIFE